MRKKIGLIILMFGFLTNGFGMSAYMQIRKSLADAVAVYSEVSYLQGKEGFGEMKRYAATLDSLFTEIKSAKTGFETWSYPLGCRITSENRDAVYKTVSKLNQVVKRVRETTKRFRLKFSPDQLPSLLQLLSENAGDYYSAVDSVRQFDLYEHPLRDKMTFMGLQDYSLLLMAEGDTSLWRLHKYAPQLTVLYLFGAEVDYDVLARMELEKCNKLSALDLAQNRLDSLPPTFNEKNRLRYLSLSSNNLKSLPEGFEKWSTLEYLDLRYNLLPEDERERIFEALPRTKVIF